MNIVLASAMIPRKAWNLGSFPAGSGRKAAARPKRATGSHQARTGPEIQGQESPPLSVNDRLYQPGSRKRLTPTTKTPRTLVRKVRPHWRKSIPSWSIRAAFSGNRSTAPKCRKPWKKSWARLISRFPQQLKNGDHQVAGTGFSQNLPENLAGMAATPGYPRPGGLQQVRQIPPEVRVKNPKILLQLIFGGTPRD